MAAKRGTEQSFPVKITVLKKLFHKDFVDKYTSNPEEWAPCEAFEEGQEFVACKETPWDVPPGFCGWAWADIQKIVHGMARGAAGDMFVTCCTDGYRPVMFKLEKIRDD